MVVFATPAPLRCRPRDSGRSFSGSACSTDRAGSCSRNNRGARSPAVRAARFAAVRKAADPERLRRYRATSTPTIEPASRSAQTPASSSRFSTAATAGRLLEFDEAREFAEFERREVVFRSASTKAALLVANTPEVSTRCAAATPWRDRAVCIPFSPSPYVSRSTANDDRDAAILQKYDLEPNYLFYPAQFWSHRIMRRCWRRWRVARPGIEVDTGAVRIGPRRASRGRSFVAQYGLADQVRILGFVPSSRISSPLYRQAAAPRDGELFRPHKSPAAGKPGRSGRRSSTPRLSRLQAGDAAILFDYDSPASLADAIVKASSAQERVRLAAAGKQSRQFLRSRPRKGTTGLPSTCCA